MYLRFFGLRQEPFSIAPDPRYLYMSERHREALAHLLYGLDAGGGFVLLSGEIGTGKTTVCRCFLEQVPATCHLAYIFNPKLTVTELLHSVCDEFGIKVTPAVAGAPTVKDHLDPLNRYLLEAHAQGRQCVLVIDEAQNLSADVLEQLRLLTNLETRERKLLQIILIGQPELRALLARPELEQLAQRVIARFHLDALSAAETAGYIAHRLAVAGHEGALPFDRAALRRVQRLTGGVPRRINLLCDRALLGAYAEGRERVNSRTLDRAAAEVFDRSGRRGKPGWAALAAGLGAATVLLAIVGVLAAAGVLNWPSRPGVHAAAPAAPASAASATASAPAAAASAASAVAASGAAVVPLFDAATDLALLPRDERALWRELGSAWSAAGADIGSGEPCDPAPGAVLRCYRTAGATLTSIRLLDRPGLIALADGRGRVLHARLLGLDRQAARLAAGDRTWSLPLAALAGHWQGEFATLWRPPPGYAQPLTEGASGPAVQALAEGLARLQADAGASALAAPDAGAVFDAPLRARLAAFQLAQGLKPDGVAGPTTFMLLNRALGVAEPRLDSAATETTPAPGRK